MSSTKPAQNPPRANAQAETQEKTPTQLPPMTMDSAVEARPRELTAEETALTARAAQADAVPTLEPPQSQTAGAGAVATWISDKRVNALWSMNQDRNSWAAFTDAGWKKLSTASPSAIIALTMLAAHAKQMQTSVSYREEADSMVHELYVW